MPASEGQRRTRLWAPNSSAETAYCWPGCPLLGRAPYSPSGRGHGSRWPQSLQSDGVRRSPEGAEQRVGLLCSCAALGSSPTTNMLRRGRRATGIAKSSVSSGSCSACRNASSVTARRHLKHVARGDGFLDASDREKPCLRVFSGHNAHAKT